MLHHYSRAAAAHWPSARTPHAVPLHAHLHAAPRHRAIVYLHLMNNIVLRRFPPRGACASHFTAAARK